ncbi:hypothetical protein KAU33_02130 [Candidatus Dependentiae bacterium]|nr:hypothetical protein [Candidatus Dependentiae bacterium]
MKTRFYSIIVLFAILAVALPWDCSKDESPTEPLPPEPEPVLIFYDGFETNEPGSFPSGWGDTFSMSIQIDDSYARADSQSLMIAPIMARQTSGIYKVGSAYEGDSKFYFSVYIYLVGDEHLLIEYMGIKIYLAPFGIYLDEMLPANLIDLPNDQWYDCKLEIDWDKSLCSLVVDSVGSISMSFTKPTSASGWGVDLSIHNTSTQEGAYWIDEVSIYEMKVELE